MESQRTSARANVLPESQLLIKEASAEVNVIASTCAHMSSAEMEMAE